MSYEEEGIDSDTDKPIFTGSVRFLHDDQPIGCIQDLKFRANTEQPLPELEITFPDLHDQGIDPAYAQHPNFIKEIDHQIKLLSKIPNVKIHLRSLDAEAKVCTLDEIGTDGHIDLIPMKKRWSP